MKVIRKDDIDKINFDNKAGLKNHFSREYAIKRYFI